ncbi:MAG: YdiU family protein [Pseudomonadota bacterium]
MLNLSFDNQFTAGLPSDGIDENYRRQLSNALYSRVAPTPVRAPHMIAYAAEVADLIGLDPKLLDSDEFVQVFAGNQMDPGMDPHATCYGGHQFGNWAGQLGDGRAINLGEVNVGDQHFMLQLKGAGPTPFSRTADGLAVLRSSVREFLCSEAMYHLGVPTTRALCLIGTGEEVVRDMLYDGNPEAEPGAVVCRVSSSFVRFGHYQLLAARQEIDLLKTFTNFVIEREFHHLHTIADEKEKWLTWFEEVSQRTADLMVHWMRVGFVHGVMNTDNLSILGETIDYGPYGWLEDFDPDWTPNTTDAGQRRYRYGQQPGIAQWNLLQLANAIVPLIEDTKPLEESLSKFAKHYEQSWHQMMANKLGLHVFDETLNNGLMRLMTQAETDMTVLYRQLAQLEFEPAQDIETISPAFYQSHQLNKDLQAEWVSWVDTYRAVLTQQNVTNENRKATMNRTNPKYVMRNYLAQLAIDDAEKGDFERVNKTLDVMRKPYDEQPENKSFAEIRPEWARTRAGCSMLSCSS